MKLASAATSVTTVSAWWRWTLNQLVTTMNAGS
jgi:hypothetical protein